MSKRSLFGRSKAIERRIDEFLDKVSESALVLVAALEHSLAQGASPGDETERSRMDQLLELKRSCSGLRREIEAELYTEMLIPDLLADVCSLIEALHGLVEEMHHAMRFLRYAPIATPEFVRTDGLEMVRAVGKSVDHLVQATRAYFRDYTHVRDYVHKVGFYESESDALRDKLLEQIYQTDHNLAVQDHIARNVRELDAVADHAERIGDTLTICAIKRAE